jgi:ketosteroid isomerase-like protein
MHPNEQQLREGYEAFSRGDLDTIREKFDPDITWVVGGRNPLAGTYRGIDEVFGFFGKLLEATGGTFKVRVIDVCANDRHAMCLTESTAEVEGQTLADEDMACYDMRDGKIVRARFFNGDQYQTDQIFAGALGLAEVITQPKEVRTEA